MNKPTPLVERLRVDAEWHRRCRRADQAGHADDAATLITELIEALEAIARETSAEDDAGENYRWDDREGVLDYAYATAVAALAKVQP